jgi:hypothetical protein
VIERVETTLRTLAALPASELGTPAGERLAADCADALRLELDCPQRDLAPAERAALRALSDLLDGGQAGGAEVSRAAAVACAALGLAPATVAPVLPDELGPNRRR